MPLKKPITSSFRIAAEALRWYRKAQDNPAAWTAIGTMYHDGVGVARSLPEALRWYRKAADEGDGTAQWRLGLAYANGEGTAKSATDAWSWINKAAEAGNSEAALWIRTHSLSGSNRIANLAPVDTGAMVSRGNADWDQQDFWSAHNEYRAAANEQNPEGMAGLGFMYARGSGVAVDYVEAMRWVRKAADLGSASGMFGVGTQYRAGQGVAQDYAEARRWFRRAADRDLPAAMMQLGIMYLEGEGVTADASEAARWFHKAADAGSANTRNEVRDWMQKAATAGSSEAREWLESLAGFFVFFDWNSATLSERARQIIKQVAEKASQVPYSRIEVAGHTDTSFSPDDAQPLSEREANAVKAELIKDGVPSNTLSVQGYGKTQLLVQTADGVKEPQNRRVEIQIKSGPTVAVMPAPGKPFEAFEVDQANCEQSAGQQIPSGGVPADGAVAAQQAQMSPQQRYDLAYTQCMYARGNQVPGFAPPPPRGDRSQ